MEVGEPLAADLDRPVDPGKTGIVRDINTSKTGRSMVFSSIDPYFTVDGIRQSANATITVNSASLSALVQATQRSLAEPRAAALPEQQQAMRMEPR